MRVDFLIKVSLTVLSYCALTSSASYISNNYYKWKYPKSTTTTTQKSTYDLLKFRHHPRYPNLDRVMTKLKNNKHNHPHLLKTTPRPTTTTTERDPFEDYGDLIDEDTENSNEYEDEWEDDDPENEYEDEEMSEDDRDSFLDDEDEWQAEEATEQSISHSKISSLSKYKWDHYGTRAKVEESRRQHMILRPSNEEKDTSAVIQHVLKVGRDGQCKTPQPKVIPVQHEHPDPSKTYTPHCTILHRCAEDTGCCSNFTTRCGPKKKDQVHLYFYAKTLGVSTGTKVERLIFYNHTECECIEKSTTKISNSSTEEYQQSSPSFKTILRYPENLSTCKCPQEFVPRYRYGVNRCTCDCQSDNQDCLKMRKGEEYFGMSDRLCILYKQCGVPMCEYGTYLPEKGRCQKNYEDYRRASIR